MADPLARLIFPIMTMVVIEMAMQWWIVMEGIVTKDFAGRIASKHRLIAVLDSSSNQDRVPQDLPIEAAVEDKPFSIESFKARFVGVRIVVQ